jgi:hypothetical protein
MHMQLLRQTLIRQFTLHAIRITQEHLNFQLPLLKEEHLLREVEQFEFA